MLLASDPWEQQIYFFLVFLNDHFLYDIMLSLPGG